MGRVSCSNTGNLAQPSVSRMGQFLDVPGTGDSFVAFAFAHPSDIDYLILPKHLVHGDMLL